MARRPKTIKRNTQPQYTRRKTKRSANKTKFAANVVLENKQRYRKTPRYVHNPIPAATDSQNLAICGVVHASWCGACQGFIPEWNKMKSEIQANMGSVPVVTWEENVHKADIDGFTGKYGGTLSVNGYPTIFKLKTGGAATESYEGARDAASITKWLREPTAV